MRILVLETDRRAADDAVESLTAAGHEVVRCHDRDRPAFPCRALCAEGCAIDGWVDVALTMRAHPYPRPTPTEDGVSCAIRRHIPLVVGGMTALHPFAPWTAATAGYDDVVEACEVAAAAPLPEHSRVATEEARRLVAAEGLPGDDVVAIARRSPRRVTVEVEASAEIDRRLGDLIAVRVAGKVRALDRDVAVIDVRVQTA